VACRSLSSAPLALERAERTRLAGSKSGASGDVCYTLFTSYTMTFCLDVMVVIVNMQYALDLLQQSSQKMDGSRL